MSIRENIYTQVARLLIVVFGLFILNNAVYLHAHQLSEGELILHAHPYSKSQDTAPVKSHHHTSAQLFTLAHLQLLFLFLVIISATVFRTGLIRVFYFIYVPQHQKCYVNLSGRSPPFSLA